MFAHLVDTFETIEFEQVHRFRHDWERDSSLPGVQRSEVYLIGYT